MRGKAGTSCGNPESKRITPAYAGKSAQLEGASPLAQDHPRVCGEKQASTGARHTDRRITPAYAGKRVKISLKFRASEDHPRVCGEKFQRSIRLPVRSGSPPRMRGKGVRHLCEMLFTGITPAYAGKSFLIYFFARYIQDHPRVCGEKKSRRCCTSIGLGSPPRMRGKADKHCLPFFKQGITPAYAGKRAVLPYAPAHSGDHPRVCGEKARMRSGLSQQKGSPPRMRGKDLLIEHCLFTEGITPAYAGKSRYLMRKSGEQKDHPRVCGEKELRQAIAVQHIGSPPRMRGKVAMFCRAVRAHRITPAYAGKREQAQ